LNIDFILGIPEDNYNGGGVIDYGDWNEGHCVQIKSIKPNTFFKMAPGLPHPPSGTSVMWLVCGDTPIAKKRIIDSLIMLKIQKQRDNGIYLYESAGHNAALAHIDTSVNNMVNRTPDDGYWIIAENWGPCTINCQSIQRLQCVLPKPTSKQCVGPSIRFKPCNAPPCPSSPLLQNNAKTALEQYVKLDKPIVQVLPLSLRPLRYDKCEIKESDAFMIPSDNPERIPVRLVMNHKTLTIYQDETMKVHLAVFMLSQSTLTKDSSDHQCLEIASTSAKVKLCELPGSKEFVQDWLTDFKLFKEDCKQKRPTYVLEENEENKLKTEYEKKLSDLKTQIVEERKKEIEKKTEINEEMILKKKIEEANMQALLALQKESKLEEMFLKEEEEREKEEQELLAKQLEREKVKEECLQDSIKEKDMEDQHSLNRYNIQKRIEEIKQETQRQIELRRDKVKQKVLEMRNLNDHFKRKIQKEIALKRRKMATVITNSKKKGDMNKCFVPKEGNADDLTKMTDFCRKNYETDPEDFVLCMKTSEFCTMCCDAEIGDFYFNERGSCYRKCTNILPTPCEQK
jgi:hypothetical protein